MQDLTDKTVFIAGGSSGLGKELAKALAARGANVTIFARRKEALVQAQNAILDARLNANRKVDAVSVDMSNAADVEAILQSQPCLPDMLYCVAGGTSRECGYLTDIQATDIEVCMRNNYFTAAYTAQSILKLWKQDDVKATVTIPKLRQIVFINSAAAFVGLPGYTAYAPSKCATRSLADTLRMEALRYSCAASTYTIHCAFPSNFMTDAFLEEQKRKPDLTKRLEGTDKSLQELEKKMPSAEKVAKGIIAGVERGDFALCDDSAESALLFSNMVGPSPKRGLGIVDSIMGIVVGLFVWPILRRRWDAMCEKDGK